jgi:hypothetical protein
MSESESQTARNNFIPPWESRRMTLFEIIQFSSTLKEDSLPNYRTDSIIVFA